MPWARPTLLLALGISAFEMALNGEGRRPVDKASSLPFQSVNFADWEQSLPLWLL